MLRPVLGVYIRTYNPRDTRQETIVLMITGNTCSKEMHKRLEIAVLIWLNPDSEVLKRLCVHYLGLPMLF